MIRGFILLLLARLHLSLALFENCDEIYKLETDENVTISWTGSLNLTSCRYSIEAPVNYNVEVTCSLRIDQLDSQKCPLKRFFVSVDGINNLRGSDYFCNRNGSTRTFRRQSVMNRLILAYVAQAADGNETFSCVAKRIEAQCDCGWSRSSRIFNGEDAELHEFPSMVALVALSIARVFCGGTIISERWFLTGAHCFNEEIYADLNNVIAVVGEHNLNSSSETIYTESYEIEKFVKHRDYSKENFDQDNDIAIVRTVKPILFSRAVGPACLPWSFSPNSFDEKYVFVVGFGLLDYFGGPATVLQKVSLEILQAKHCADSVRNSAKMCTYSVDKDSCTSDSGGPLYFVQDRQFVVGLVSYGVGCGSTTPSVNSRITSYLSWIEETSEGEKFCRK